MATAIDHLTGPMKPMVLALNKLNHYGVGSIADVSVPQVVLVGDQSTGKSSLVEALAQIRVPRGAGTCTRCPLEISVLNHPGPWTAEVKLHRKWTQVGPGSDLNGGFPGWSESQASGVLEYFCDVSNVADLELAIQRAQLATLNPSKPPKRYLRMTAAAAAKEANIADLQFSPNPVVVEIRGEELPNLSFVDLPGIISQSDAGHHLVTLVQTLAKYHMKQKNTLILLVVSMESDMMNSAASGLVREIGASDRCVGVLTKPDRRDEDPRQWQDVLSGHKFQLELGYFVTKQPATGSLDISYEEARAEEMGFFGSDLWQIDFPNVNKHQGTRNLQIALSKQLLAISSKSIPEIQIKLEEKLQVVEQELALLPEPTKAPRYEIKTIVSEFHRMVDRDFGRYRHKGHISTVRAGWKTMAEEFSNDIIKERRPRLQYTVDLEEQPKKRKRVKQEEVPHRASPSVRLKREGQPVIVLDDINDSAAASVPESPQLTRRMAPMSKCYCNAKSI
jgi:hypothetical protein